MSRKVLDDYCPGLAGQLAYFTLFSLFPFLLSLVALAGLVIGDPASLLKTLTERMQGFLPGDAVGLLEGYIDLTLRNADLSVLVFAVLATFWSGWAAADAIVKAVNRAGLYSSSPKRSTSGIGRRDASASSRERG